MGTGFGYGPTFAYSEGFNTFRAIFTTGGMTLNFNGETIGTDNSAQDPVWGFQIKSLQRLCYDRPKTARIRSTR